MIRSIVLTTLIALITSCTTPDQQVSTIYNQLIDNKDSRNDSTAIFTDQLRTIEANNKNLSNQSRAKIAVAYGLDSGLSSTLQPISHYQTADSLAADSTELKLYIKALLFLTLYRSGDKTAATEQLNLGRSILNIVDSPRLSAQYISIDGTLASVRRDRNAAIKYFQQANSIASTHNLPTRPLYLLSMGKQYAFSKNYNRALQIYREALEVAKEEKLPIYIPDIHRYMGKIFRLTDQLELAEEHIIKYVTASKISGDNKKIYTSLQELGKIYLRQSKFKAADSLFTESVTVARKGEDLSSIAAALTNHAKFLSSINELERAERAVKEAYQIKISNDNHNIDITLQILGDIMVKQGKESEALNIYHEVILNSDSLQNPEVRSIAKREIAKIYDKRGEKEIAAYNYKEYIEENQKLIDKIAKDRVIESTTRYEQMKIDQQQNIKLQDIAATKDLTIYILIAIAAAICGVSISIIRRGKKINLKITQDHLNKDFNKIKEQIDICNEGHNYGQDIFDLIENRKIFLDPDISLKKLASMLGTNTTYTSKAISSRFDCNFRTLINRYRIAESKRTLATSNKSISEIAQSIGYSSVNIFYKYFKEDTGITPTEYRKQIIK